MGEARTLVAGFIHNKQSTVWLDRALLVTRRIYGKGSDERVRKYMRIIWREELLK